MAAVALVVLRALAVLAAFVAALLALQIALGVALLAGELLAGLVGVGGFVGRYGRDRAGLVGAGFAVFTRLVLAGRTRLAVLVAVLTIAVAVALVAAVTVALETAFALGVGFGGVVAAAVEGLVAGGLSGFGSGLGFGGGLGDEGGLPGFTALFSDGATSAVHALPAFAARGGRFGGVGVICGGGVVTYFIQCAGGSGRSSFGHDFGHSFSHCQTSLRRFRSRWHGRYRRRLRPRHAHRWRGHIRKRHFGRRGGSGAARRPGGRNLDGPDGHRFISDSGDFVRTGAQGLSVKNFINQLLLGEALEIAHILGFGNFFQVRQQPFLQIGEGMHSVNG